MRGPKGKHAWTAKVGEKGQIVIPKEARTLFGIEPGDTVILLGDEKRGIAIAHGERYAEMLTRLMPIFGDEEEPEEEHHDGD